MGLIGWIKDKYYDNRLDKADSLVLEGDLDKAEEIYRDLLGKQVLAVVNLANMYVTHSDGVEAKLTALKSIVELRSYTDDLNRLEYEKTFRDHVANIDKLAGAEFKAKRYPKAVLLVDAIKTFRKKNETFDSKVAHYHAYKAFYQSLQTSDYSKLLGETIKWLKSYTSTCSDDIKVFVNELKSVQRYVRAIKLLIPFIALNKDYSKVVSDCIVEVISDNDKDIRKPRKISDFCSDANLCKEAALDLNRLSSQAAEKKDLKKSVLFDSYASEFLSGENNFNYDRCVHLLEEASSREDAQEIEKILKTAKELELSEQQINNLKIRISQIAKSSDPAKGIKICRLFKSENTFASIYVDLASKLAAIDANKLDIKELLEIIKSISDEESFVDVLSAFVNYIPSYETE